MASKSEHNKAGLKTDPLITFANKEESTVMNLLSKWASRTSIHGVPYIESSKNILLKLIWLVLFLGFSALLVALTRESLSDYFKFQVNTLVELKKFEKDFEFPTVTFCNLQICNFTDYDFPKYLADYINNENTKFGTPQNEVIMKKLKEDQTKTSYFLAKEIFLRQHSDDDLNKVLNKNKTSINKMLISCQFDGNDCGEDDFEFILMGEFQKCYKFNSGIFYNESRQRHLKKTNMQMKGNGLHMELYVGGQIECRSPLATTSGLVIYVHNKTYTITDDDNGIQVEPGTHADIKIMPTFIQKKPSPYSQCFDLKALRDSYNTPENMDIIATTNTTTYRNITLNSSPEVEELFKYLNLNASYNDLILEALQSKKNETYTQQFCLQLCYQKFLKKFCDCYDHTLADYDPGPPDEGQDELEPCPKFIDSLYNCQYLIKRLFYNGRNDDNCLKKCPKECDFTVYDISVTSSAFPSSSYLEILRSLKRKNYVPELDIPPDSIDRESVLSFNVYYSSNTFTTIIEKERMTWTNLLASLGGYLGLFLGMSVLSVFEIIELIFSLISLFCRNKETKMVQHSNKKMMPPNLGVIDINNTKIPIKK